jgi:N-acetyl-alpha-D-glucosaminyl L-malate synthase BshA
MKIGITCFPTFGGSGLIASEIGLAMADRGHTVHFIARALPVRVQGTTRNIQFHEVKQSNYPALTDSSAYPIALASKMIEVATTQQLDLLHVHYAVPHATAAWMACEVMGAKAPKIVTTLHGTDITLVGTDPSHLPITRYSILRSDAVTAPSAFLRQATWQNFDIPESQSIEIISNFVDTERYGPNRDRAALRKIFPGLKDGAPVLVHVSNFRPVKRIRDVISIFAEVNRQLPANLVLIGDGPERAAAEQQVRALELQSKVAFLGERDQFVELLAACDVFLLPSELESFGLAALEALSCGVPVVASNIGGIPELVEDGQTGCLAPLGDVAAMANHALGLLKDPTRWSAFSQRARKRVLERFRVGPAIDRYEALYRKVTSPLSSSPGPSQPRP